MERMDHKELEQRIAQARGGDRAAQEALILAIQDRVYYHCKKILKHEQDALDATQEVLIVVLTELDKLREPGAFWGWVNGITANRCRRTLARDPRRVRELQPLEDEEGNSVLEQFEDTDEQVVPDKALDNEETRRLILEVIDSLPAEQKMCVLFYYYDEMPVKDIAQATGVSEGTVKSRLNYARKAIREKVEALAKQGTKLYGLSPLPFLAYFLRLAAQTEGLGAAGPALTASVLAGAQAAAGAAAGGAAAGTTAGTAAGTTAGAAAGTAAGGAATGTATGTAAAVGGAVAAKAGVGLGVKVAAVVVALAIGGGAVLGGVHLASTIRGDAAPTPPIAAEAAPSPSPTPEPTPEPTVTPEELGELFHDVAYYGDPTQCAMTAEQARGFLTKLHQVDGERRTYELYWQTAGFVPGYTRAALVDLGGGVPALCVARGYSDGQNSEELDWLAEQVENSEVFGLEGSKTFYWYDGDELRERRLHTADDGDPCDYYVDTSHFCVIHRAMGDPFFYCEAFPFADGALAEQAVTTCSYGLDENGRINYDDVLGDGEALYRIDGAQVTGEEADAWRDQWMNGSPVSTYQGSDVGFYVTGMCPGEDVAAALEGYITALGEDPETVSDPGSALPPEGPAEVFDGLAYYGDFSKCRMTKEQAEAFAQKLQEEIADTGHTLPEEKRYVFAAMADTGNGVPALYLADVYQSADTPYQEENGTLYFKRNGGHEVWTYTNGEITRFPKQTPNGFKFYKYFAFYETGLCVACEDFYDPEAPEHVDIMFPFTDSGIAEKAETWCGNWVTSMIEIEQDPQQAQNDSGASLSGLWIDGVPATDLDVAVWRAKWLGDGPLAVAGLEVGKGWYISGMSSGDDMRAALEQFIAAAG